MFTHLALIFPLISHTLFDASFNHYDTPIDFLMKPPPRSFSIDVGSMNNQNYTSSLFFDHDDTGTIKTPPQKKNNKESFDFDYLN